MDLSRRSAALYDAFADEVDAAALKGDASLSGDEYADDADDLFGESVPTVEKKKPVAKAVPTEFDGRRIVPTPPVVYKRHVDPLHEGGAVSFVTVRQKVKAKGIERSKLMKEEDAAHKAKLRKAAPSEVSPSAIVTQELPGEALNSKLAPGHKAKLQAVSTVDLRGMREKVLAYKPDKIFTPSVNKEDNGAKGRKAMRDFKNAQKRLDELAAEAERERRLAATPLAAAYQSKQARKDATRAFEAARLKVSAGHRSVAKAKAAMEAAEHGKRSVHRAATAAWKSAREELASLSAEFRAAKAAVTRRVSNGRRGDGGFRVDDFSQEFVAGWGESDVSDSDSEDEHVPPREPSSPPPPRPPPESPRVASQSRSARRSREQRARSSLSFGTVREAEEEALACAAAFLASMSDLREVTEDLHGNGKKGLVQRLTSVIPDKGLRRRARKGLKQASRSAGNRLGVDVATSRAFKAAVSEAMRPKPAPMRRADRPSRAASDRASASQRSRKTSLSLMLTAPDSGLHLVYNFLVTPGPAGTNASGQSLMPSQTYFAASHGEFEIHEMTISLKPLTSQFTSPNGLMYVAWLPDPSAVAPTTLEELNTLTHKAVGRAWEKIVLRVPASKTLFTQSQTNLLQAPGNCYQGRLLFYTDLSGPATNVSQVEVFSDITFREFRVPPASVPTPVIGGDSGVYHLVLGGVTSPYAPNSTTITYPPDPFAGATVLQSIGSGMFQDQEVTVDAIQDAFSFVVGMPSLPVGTLVNLLVNYGCGLFEFSGGHGNAGAEDGVLTTGSTMPGGFSVVPAGSISSFNAAPGIGASSLPMISPNSCAQRSGSNLTPCMATGTRLGSATAFDTFAPSCWNFTFTTLTTDAVSVRVDLPFLLSTLVVADFETWPVPSATLVFTVNVLGTMSAEVMGPEGSAAGFPERGSVKVELAPDVALAAQTDLAAARASPAKAKLARCGRPLAPARVATIAEGIGNLRVEDDDDSYGSLHGNGRKRSFSYSDIEDELIDLAGIRWRDREVPPGPEKRIHFDPDPDIEGLVEALSSPNEGWEVWPFSNYEDDLDFEDILRAMFEPEPLTGCGDVNRSKGHSFVSQACIHQGTGGNTKLKKVAQPKTAKPNGADRRKLQDTAQALELKANARRLLAQQTEDEARALRTQCESLGCVPPTAPQINIRRAEELAGFSVPTKPHKKTRRGAKVKLTPEQREFLMARGACFGCGNKHRKADCTNPESTLDELLARAAALPRAQSDGGSSVASSEGSEVSADDASDGGSAARGELREAIKNFYRGEKFYDEIDGKTFWAFEELFKLSREDSARARTYVGRLDQNLMRSRLLDQLVMGNGLDGFAIDQQANPICGMAAVHVGSGRKLRDGGYEKLLDEAITRAMEGGNEVDPDVMGAAFEADEGAVFDRFASTIGDSAWLRGYCEELGFGCVIINSNLLEQAKLKLALAAEMGVQSDFSDNDFLVSDHIHAWPHILANMVNKISNGVDSRARWIVLMHESGAELPGLLDAVGQVERYQGHVHGGGGPPRLAPGNACVANSGHYFLYVPNGASHTEQTPFVSNFLSNCTFSDALALMASRKVSPKMGCLNELYAYYFPESFLASNEGEKVRVEVQVYEQASLGNRSNRKVAYTQDALKIQGVDVHFRLTFHHSAFYAACRVEMCVHKTVLDNFMAMVYRSIPHGLKIEKCLDSTNLLAMANITVGETGNAMELALLLGCADISSFREDHTRDFDERAFSGRRLGSPLTSTRELQGCRGARTLWWGEFDPEACRQGTDCLMPTVKSEDATEGDAGLRRRFLGDVAPWGPRSRVPSAPGDADVIARQDVILRGAGSCEHVREIIRDQVPDAVQPLMNPLSREIPTRIIEGDDAGATGLDLVKPEHLEELDIKCSMFTRSTWGNLTFLSKAHDAQGNPSVDLLKYCSKVMYTVSGVDLPRDKQLFLMRMKATSYHDTLGPQPILTALVRYIFRHTESVVPFRRWADRVDHWKKEHLCQFVREIGDCEVPLIRRYRVAEGFGGFGSITIAQQLAAERLIDADCLAFGDIFAEFDDFRELVASERLFSDYIGPQPAADPERLKDFLHILANPSEGPGAEVVGLEKPIELPPWDGPLVAFSEDDRLIAVKGMDVARRNQEKGGINLLIRVGPKARVLELGVRKPVAAFPLGTIHGLYGRVGLGPYPTNSGLSLAAAVIGRHLSKETVGKAVMRQSLIDKALPLVESQVLLTADLLKELIERDFIESFEEHYRSIKPASWIKRKVDTYRRFKAGEMSGQERRKYLRRGVFVKCEGNAKWEKVRGVGTLVGRPRAIFMMNDVDLIEGHQVTALFEAFNRSAGRAWQKKADGPDEFKERMVDFFHRGTEVASMDITSFESSIHPEYKVIERYAMKRLCEIAGFTRTLRALQRRWADPTQILEGKGLVFGISSRLSGDFETSFGNGFMMLSLIHFLEEAHPLRLAFEA